MALQNLVGSQTDGIAKLVGFQIFEQLRNSEIGITAQVLAPETRPTIALQNRVKHGLPIVRAVNVFRSQRTAFPITMLVEDKQRMIAAAVKMAVVGRAFL